MPPPDRSSGRRGNRRKPSSSDPAAQAEGPSPTDQETGPAASPPDHAPSRTRRRRLPWALILGGLTLAGALVASWVLLPIRQVTVGGNERLKAAQIRQLAGATPEFGWLYYGSWRARGLLNSPWIQSAVVTRRFPDQVTIQVTERQPVALWKRTDRETVMVAADGTVLPQAGAPATLPVIQGWGPTRLPDALTVLRALGQYNVKSVMYSPSGFKVKLAAGSVWSGDVQALLKYAGSISMYPDKNINIYPWGVSVQE
ncbi:putative Cell division protein FtsQ [Deinococcus deserti VCD115]|uniref:Putative Cell division protein FtsQ n=1 Tax=Deinococcus deserti (strain DSM 17065 / CIP 109153 / LMG 22923 / VCD115) TaxID=546414 RepID=C1CW43_DEIDV|nr:putative Cell division protein FtsQ [Deinococcus deserti VCD115]